MSSLHRRRGGAVVSALDFRSGSRWFEPSLCLRVVSLIKTRSFIPHLLSLFNQVYKWVPAIIMLGVNLAIDGLASHPGGIAIFLDASCYRNRS